MKSKTKILLGSTLTIAMCASLITGSTLALFTSESKTNIAVTSGKVDVNASVTDLWTNSNAVDDIPLKDIVGDAWIVASEVDDKFIGDFATGGTATYSEKEGTGFLELNQIVPGDAVKFIFSVENKSSISIKYQIRLRAEEDEYVGTLPDPYKDTKLSSALEVMLGGEETTGLVYMASEWSGVIEVGSGISDTEVRIRLPKDAGNQYQERSCSITLSVFAVQSNAATCDETGFHEYHDDVCIWCGEELPFTHDDASGTCTITGLKEKYSDVTEIEIPNKINGLQTKIGVGAFKDNTTLLSVEIADGIKEIPDYAFALTRDDLILGTNGRVNQQKLKDNAHLKRVRLPSDLVSVGAGAFAYCYALNDFGENDLSKYTDLEKIGTNAFAYTNIREVKLKNGQLPKTAAKINVN